MNAVNYQKLYALLVGAVDEVIEPLENIIPAIPYAEKLKSALLLAEELYIATEENEDIIPL